MLITIPLLLAIWYLIHRWAKKAEADDNRKAKAKIMELYEPQADCI